MTRASAVFYGGLPSPNQIPEGIVHRAVCPRAEVYD